MPYEGAKASFNSAAELYDRARPSYPAAAVRRIIEKSQLTKKSRILEIGAGTGKASVLFARHGYPMLCLEPGVQMGAIARKNLEPYPNAQVKTTTFEDWGLQKNAFDLIISAQAFHWVDAEIGFRKCAKALKPGGWVALFWNLPNDPETGVYNRIQRAYQRLAPEMTRRHKQKSQSDHVAEIRQDLESHRDLFPLQKVYRFSWQESYSPDSYLELLSTYSDHIALPPADRDRLYDAIRKAIHSQGQTHLKHYVTILAMARRSE